MDERVTVLEQGGGVSYDYIKTLKDGIEVYVNSNSKLCKIVVTEDHSYIVKDNVTSTIDYTGMPPTTDITLYKFTSYGVVAITRGYLKILQNSGLAITNAGAEYTFTIPKGEYIFSYS